MRLITISLMVLFTTTLSACSSVDKSAHQFGDWEITIIEAELSDDLSTTKSAVQYGGDSVSYDLNIKPTEGYHFLIIEMIIEKIEMGVSSFEWNKLYILDESGIRYQRLQNDMFLKNFNFPRIPSTNINFGSVEGFIAIEIPNSVLEQKLYLVYDNETTLKIRVN
jgi:hypothetical protein